MKILFIAEDMQTNGATTALVPLMKILSDVGYDVSLFLFRQYGPWMDQIDPRVHLLPEVLAYKVSRMSRYEGVTLALKRWRWLLAVRRALAAIGARFHLKVDKYSILKSAPAVPGMYDLVIGFTVGCSWWMALEKVDAKYRIAWVDNDLKSIAGEWSRFMRPERFDALVFESLGCRDEFKAQYPALAKRAFTVHNTVDDVRVRRMAAEAADAYPKRKFRLVTVGRLTYQKGTDLIPEVAAALKDFDFEWLVVGEGIDREALETRCRELEVADRVVFTGLLTNPYGVMSSADLYVQLSRYEGWGTTLAEALVLRRYAVATDIPQFKEQIPDETVGLICRSEDVGDMAATIRRSRERLIGAETATPSRESICSPNNVRNEIEMVFNFVKELEPCI